MRDNGEEFEVQKSKEHIIRKLKRLNGNTTGNIKAMKNEQGNIRADLQRIMDILEAHWTRVFGKGGINEVEL